jgi:hypothetical protein
VGGGSPGSGSRLKPFCARAGSGTTASVTSFSFAAFAGRRRNVPSSKATFSGLIGSFHQIRSNLLSFFNPDPKPKSPLSMKLEIRPRNTSSGSTRRVSVPSNNACRNPFRGHLPAKTNIQSGSKEPGPASLLLSVHTKTGSAARSCDVDSLFLRLVAKIGHVSNPNLRGPGHRTVALKKAR